MDILKSLIQPWQVSEGQGNDGRAATTPLKSFWRTAVTLVTAHSLHLTSHYRIFEKLGGGGTRVVYKAEDVTLDVHLRQFKAWRVMRVLD